MQSSNIIIQKFSGVTVGSAKRMKKVLQLIKNSINDSDIIIVLSAVSPKKKIHGTTSKLIQATRELLVKRATHSFEILNEIEENHINILNKLITENEELRLKTEKEIKAECNSLREFLKALEIIKEITPKSSDTILSTGEKLAGIVFTAYMKSEGIDTELIDFEKIITDVEDDSLIDTNFYLNTLVPKISEELSKCKAKVPLVTGFIGSFPLGILETVGRGYSDFTASLVSLAVHAKEVQIFKNISGIYSADPLIVPQAYVLPYVTPDEASELVFYGLKTINPSCMDIAHDQKIRIKSIDHPEQPGTLIGPYTDEYKHLKSTAVLIKKDVLIYNIHCRKGSVAHGTMKKVFETFNKFGIQLDLVSTSQMNLSIALSNDINNLDLVTAELKNVGKVSIRPHMAILSVVGRKLKNQIGFAGKLFATLAENNINIHMISQGRSEINISCVINQESKATAMKCAYELIYSTEEEKKEEK
ncbi:aspartate kinase [Neocallimastix lanati (nom. inval.)]|jgi:aspartate kinase|uniref:Aspartokinase n=1 Tax=Neocallimastix californiae TaxID=1754190 RepID=A0A1Y2ERS4_9FUNG|nr:aspartate kinase [Neocallimastix sp. JGI-2020a]ORY74217.1 aspartate kinase [Neocallimastix californiae]|eukprot:ORY74217.1 aspartate kinase [Neocallimastix californiae]